MRPRNIWANLGVESIERTNDFYLSLGFKLNGNPTEDLVSFLFGDDNFVIHFFEQEKLKTSLEGELSDMRQGNEVMFSLSVESKDEFDKWVSEIEQAGGDILFDSNNNRKKFYDKKRLFHFNH